MIKHNRGKIKDNYEAAIVRSDVFRHKVEKPKKGKGSYKRNQKHKGVSGRRLIFIT